MNSLQEPAYGDLATYHLPHSEAARNAVILLPLSPGMTDEKRVRVIVALGG